MRAGPARAIGWLAYGAVAVVAGVGVAALAWPFAPPTLELAHAALTDALDRNRLRTALALFPDEIVLTATVPQVISGPDVVLQVLRLQRDRVGTPPGRRRVDIVPLAVAPAELPGVRPLVVRSDVAFAAGGHACELVTLAQLPGRGWGVLHYAVREVGDSRCPAAAEFSPGVGRAQGFVAEAELTGANLPAALWADPAAADRAVEAAAWIATAARLAGPFALVGAVPSVDPDRPRRLEVGFRPRTPPTGPRVPVLGVELVEGTDGQWRVSDVLTAYEPTGL